MTEQLAITFLAASAGFSAAVFFCIGNAFNSAKTIKILASTHWDFNPPLARALAVQRAQYVAGALLLVIAFVLQVWAALASSANPAILPQWLHTSPRLVLVGTVSMMLAGFAIAYVVYITTMRKVLQLGGI